MIEAEENNEIISTNNSEDENNIIKLNVIKKSAGNIAKPISAERIAELLQNTGYKGSIIETETRRFVESSAEGWKFRVYFFNDGQTEGAEDLTSIMFNSGWGMDPKDAEITLKSANIFNMKFRYLKAYVVSEDEYTYTETEMSQYCPDGLSDDGFKALLDMFINLRQSYVTICREMRK